MRLRLVLASAFALILPASGYAADAPSFAGKTMKIVIPYGPGGTYDKYGQTFAAHFGEHVPGKPSVIVQHMPGAGGVKAMNWAFNVMPKDGLNMIVPLDNAVVNQLMRPEKMRYDARKFQWIGASNQTNIVMAVRADSGVLSWKDLKGKALIASSSGQDTSFITCNLANGLLGARIKVVSGYKGSSTAMFAIEQGETQMATYNWLAWGSKVPHWFTGDKPFARAVLQIGVWRDPDVDQSVPMLSELVSSAEDKAVVAFIGSLGALGRGLALPPGASAELVTMLRASYDSMNGDAKFAANLKKRKLRLIPSKGADIQKIVIAAVDNATPAVVARASKMIYGK
jgi:tripartite-type tricarboxylate transporter receptor subunit TctC